MDNKSPKDKKRDRSRSPEGADRGKRQRTGSDAAASTSILLPSAPVPAPAGPHTWSVEQVEQWALKVVGIATKHAKKLVDQEINGKSLATMTEEKFERYGIPGGPSSELFEGVKALFPERFAQTLTGPAPAISVHDMLTRFSGQKYRKSQKFIFQHFYQRDAQMETVYKAAESNYESRNSGQKNAQHFVFVPGGSGIGKTRFGYETQFKLSSFSSNAALKAAFDNPLYIYIDLNNGMGFVEKLDSDCADSFRIGARLAYSYFSGDISFLRFLDLVDLKLLDSISVLEAIVRCEREKRGAIATMCVIVHIDEYQTYAKIVDDKKLEVTGGVSFFKDMLRRIGDYMISTSKDQEVFLLPICTGTSRLPLEFGPSNYASCVIKLTPLTRDDAVTMLNDAYGGDLAWETVRSSRSFDVILADTGFIPRFIEFLAHPRIVFGPTTDLGAILTNRLSQMYGGDHQSFADHLQYAVLLSLTGQKILPTIALPGVQSLEDAERGGYIFFLMADSVNDPFVQVQMPFIQLKRLNEALEVANKAFFPNKLLFFPDNLRPWRWQDFELLLPYFLSSLLRAVAMQDKKTHSLRCEELWLLRGS